MSVNNFINDTKARLFERLFLTPALLWSLILLSLIFCFKLEVEPLNQIYSPWPLSVTILVSILLIFRLFREGGKAQEYIRYFCKHLFISSTFLLTFFNIPFLVPLEIQEHTTVILTLVLSIAAAIILYDNKSQKFPEEIKKSYKYFVYAGFLCLIVSLGFLLRISNLGWSSFWVDEITLVYSASNFINGNGMTLPSGQGYYSSIISTLILSISFIIGGITEFTARIPFVVIGTLTILLNYFVVKKITEDRQVALLSSLAISISLWFINFSREVRFYALNVVFLYFILALLYDYLKTSKIKYFVYCFLVILLAISNHQLMLVFLPIWVIAYLYKNHDHIRQLNLSQLGLRSLLIPASIFLFTSVILYLNQSTIRFFLFRSYISGTWHNEIDFYIKLFFNFFPLVSLLFISSLLLSIFKKNKGYTLFNSIAIFILLFFSLVIPAKTERYIFIIYPLVLVSSVGIIVNVFNSIFKQRIISVLLSILFIIIAITPLYDGIMVSQSKISYISSLQKNKHSWREASQYLKEIIESSESNNQVVISASSMLTNYYGLKTDYTIKRQASKSFLNADGIQVDFYSGLKFVNEIEPDLNSKYYFIFDSNQSQEIPIINLVEKFQLEKIYQSEGIQIYSR